MACRPRHPFIKHLIDTLEEYGQLEDKPHRTISYMMEKSLQIYLKDGKFETQPYVPRKNIFQPGFNLDMVETLKTDCDQLDVSDQDYQMLQAIGICRQLKESVNAADLYKTLTENAYTIRHWKKNDPSLLQGGSEVIRVQEWKDV